MTWLFLSVVVAFAALLVGPSIIRMSRASAGVKQRAAKILEGRDSLTAEQFSKRFFPPAQQEAATAIREYLEADLIVDVTLIRPEDQLFEDLGFAQIDGLDANHLDLQISERFDKSIRPLFDTVQGPTIRQLIEFVAIENTADPA